MRILYITTMWSGIKEVFFSGSQEITGMPAFIRPLRALVERDDEVDVFLVHEGALPPLNCSMAWASKITFLPFELKWKNPLQMIFSQFRFLRSLYKVLRRNKYDFAYFHGSLVSIGVLVSNILHIPSGQRLYGIGTVKWDKIKNTGVIPALFRSPLHLFAFTVRKSFLLVTNDGSRGDLIFSSLFGKRKKRFRFEHLMSGVEIPDFAQGCQPEKFPRDPESRNFIVMVARIDTSKRQDLAVEIVSILKKKSIAIDLILAGPQTSSVWEKKVRSQIESLDCTRNVHFIGSVSPAERTWLFQNAIASLSLYDVSNLGNVFHEMLAAGALIIGRNDGSLNDFIRHGENGFLVDTPEQAAGIVQFLWENPHERKTIQERAMQTSREKMKTWDERVAMELDMIDSAVSQGFVK